MSLIKLALDNQQSKFQQLTNSINKLKLKPKSHPMIQSKVPEVIVSNSMMANPLQCDHAWGREE